MTAPSLVPSLRLLLAAAFSLIAVACAAGFGLFVERNVARSWSAQVHDDLGEAAFGLKGALDRAVSERWRDLQLAAGFEAMRRQDSTPQERRRVLNELKLADGQFAWIGLIDAEGRVTAATDGLLEGEDAGARPGFRDALIGPVLSDAHDPLLARHLGPSQSGEPGRVLGIAVPVRDPEGRAVGALAAGISLDFAREIERAVGVRSPRAARPEYLVVARDGTVLIGPKGFEGRPLVGPDAEAATAARDGGSAPDGAPWADGRTYLAASTLTTSTGEPALAGRAAPGLGWTVIARQDAEAALRPLAELRRRLAVWGAAIGGTLALAGALLASRVSRPLRALRRAAQQMNENGDPGPLPSVDGYREASQMSRALGALLAHRRAASSENEAARERAESALVRLRASEQRLRLALKAGRFGGWELTLSTRSLSASRAFRRMFGRGGAGAFTFDDLMLAVHADDRERVASALAASARLRTGYAIEHRILRADGRTRWVDMRARLVESEDGAPARLVGVAADITTRKRAEGALRATKERLDGTLAELEEALRQKELLLKETDHRIKNSLQIVASLLALQGGRIVDPEARRAFALAAERVRTVGEVHRRLYDSPSLERIDAGAFVRGLCADLLGSGLFEGCALEVEAEGVELAHDRIVPLGLILNELLTNAAKHGCPPGRPGLVVTVALRAMGDDELSLSVTDQGDGLPEAGPARTAGLGMRLVRALVGQLRGRLETGAGPQGRGATFTVIFPRNPNGVVIEESAPVAQIVDLAQVRGGR